MNELFTVIIYAYNNLQYLKECVDSVLEQDYSNIELLITDDSSKDFNINLINKYINDNKRINISKVTINRNEKNLGIIKNLNKAISISSGKYMMNLACDDKLHDNTVITSVVNCFNKTNALAITGFLEWCNIDMTKSGEYYPDRCTMDYVNNNPPLNLFKLLCNRNFLVGPGFSYQRELINKYGYYDEDYTLLEDYPRYLSLSRQGCNIHFIDKVLVCHRYGGISSSPGNNEEEIKLRAIFGKEIAYAKEKEINPYRNIL
ncbi:glycosyltransferase [Romboutsia sp. Marseille-P6047]|uniref:glycosyltransferase n=1 Tax=Romboutsia sp. Marseille-P6047 TaxID=2161817 RepID=UPI000F04C7C5|nr:glycosyltransferase [Romboutsia sp. Marseille-P6047]